MLETLNLTQTIDFYTNKLGFQLIELYPDSHHPTWANIKRENVEIMFTTQTASPKEAVKSSLYLYPTNVDAVWEEIKGIMEIELPIQTFDYGMREFAIRDCNGHLLHFGKQTI